MFGRQQQAPIEEGEQGLAVGVRIAGETQRGAHEAAQLIGVVPAAQARHAAPAVGRHRHGNREAAVWIVRIAASDGVVAGLLPGDAAAGDFRPAAAFMHMAVDPAATAGDQLDAFVSW